MEQQTPAGWYLKQGNIYRYWDGGAWTSFTHAVQPVTQPPHRKHKHWGLGDFFLGLLLFFVFSLGIVLVLFVVIILATSADSLSGVEDLDADRVSQSWGAAVILLGAGAASAAAFIGVPAYATYRKGKRSLREDFGFAFKFIDLPIGLGVALAGLTAGALISFAGEKLFGEVATNASSLPTSVGEPNFLILATTLFVVALVVPIAEELFFRGLGLRAFENKYSIIPAIIFSSAIFGVLHMQNFSSWSSVIVIPVVTGTYGFIFACVTHWTKRLGGAIVGHITINALAVIFTFFSLGGAP